MASSSEQRMLTFKAGAATLQEFRAVKFGSSDKHVVKSSAATDKHVGISQNAGVSADDPIEVALPGGGGKAKLGGTVTRGDALTSDANGKLITTTTAGDQVVAKAMASGVLDDVIGVEVVDYKY